MDILDYIILIVMSCITITLVISSIVSIFYKGRYKNIIVTKKRINYYKYYSKRDTGVMPHYVIYCKYESSPRVHILRCEYKSAYDKLKVDKKYTVRIKWKSIMSVKK